MRYGREVEKSKGNFEKKTRKKIIRGKKNLRKN